MTSDLPAARNRRVFARENMAWMAIGAGIGAASFYALRRVAIAAPMYASSPAAPGATDICVDTPRQLNRARRPF